MFWWPVESVVVREKICMKKNDYNEMLVFPYSSQVEPAI